MYLITSAPRLQRGVYGLLFLTIKNRNKISLLRLKSLDQLPLVANEGEVVYLLLKCVNLTSFFKCYVILLFLIFGALQSESELNFLN